MKARIRRFLKVCLFVQKADITTCEQHFERVTQTVKAMCSALGNVETHEITEKIKTLRDMLKTTTTISNKSCKLYSIHIFKSCNCFFYIIVLLIPVFQLNQPHLPNKL